MTTTTTTQRDEALARLRQLCPPGTTIWTSVKHVSRSGMLRAVSAHIIVDNEPHWLNGYLDSAGLFTLDRNHQASRVSGCGMDMTWHLVYNVSHVLYPDGFGCIGKKCPSNDHHNGDRSYALHCYGGTREHCAEGHEHVEHWHKSGGYALLNRNL